LKNTTVNPTAHSLHDFYVAANRAVAGCQWHEVTIKWNGAGLIEYEAQATGLSTAPQTKPTFSFTGLLPTPAWVGIATIGGGVVTKTTEGQVKFVRKMEVLKAINNTQVPISIFLGPLVVEW